jgi:molybdate transport system substrate-binding protein
LSSSLAALLLLLFSSQVCFPAELLVAAAADLARAEKPLNQLFTQKTGHTLRLVLGSSGQLTRQIESGAPYDVFLSANDAFVQELAKSGRIQQDSVRVYAIGRLALWSNSGRFKAPEDLTGDSLRHLAIANPEHAPYGVAAKQLLVRLGLWKKLEPRIVYGENVRQTLQYAESGNADAAITAWTLVFDRKGVLLSSELHAPIRQSGGIVSSSRQQELAGRFLDMLASQDGIALIESIGLFRPVQ